MGKPYNLDQDSFKGYEDDAGEGAGTQKAAVNNDWSQAPDENFRVRFLVQETNGGEALALAIKLQRQLNSGGWGDVTASSTIVKMLASSWLTEGNDCTQVLGSGTHELDNNGQEDNDGTFTTGTGWLADEDIECEFCCQILSGDVSGGNTVELRLIEDGGTLFTTYTNTPSLTVAANINVTPSEAAALAALVAPSITLGSLDIAPTGAATETALVAPSIVLGGIDVTPAFAIVTTVSLAPAIHLSDLDIPPPDAAVLAALVAPTTILGALNISPANAEVSAALVAPVVVALQQEGFRWRNDDGNEAAATWRQNQDVNDAVGRNTNIRLRVLVNATGDPASAQYQLEYKETSGGAEAWRQVPET